MSTSTGGNIHHPAALAFVSGPQYLTPPRCAVPCSVFSARTSFALFGWRRQTFSSKSSLGTHLELSLRCCPRLPPRRGVPGCRDSLSFLAYPPLRRLRRIEG